MLLVGSIVTAVAAAVATPVPVKTTRHNEVSPSAGGDWLVWSRSRQRRVSPFDLFAQHASDPAFKVNRKGTQAYGGGIDGTRLLYQLIRGQFATQSDLRLYDLQTRKLKTLPAGINTKNWECCGTISGAWILFSRGRAYSRTTQRIILANLLTGERREVDRLRNRNGVLSAGQVSGNYAVWARCDPYPQCAIYRYDLTTGAATALPTLPAKVVYSPSVNPFGTVYYVRSTKGCGKSVELVKQTLAGGPEVVASLPQGRDVDITYVETPGSNVPPPREVVLNHLYYDTVLCKKQTWDIYRVDDLQRLPPP
ncbi:MAG TPA: hypothetical protein VN732_08020 [Solirubrobacterales bacterium]|nr:hypothetical protein [Solirubrobacterales bacterium]